MMSFLKETFEQVMEEVGKLSHLCTVGGFLKQDIDRVLYTKVFLHMGRKVTDLEKNFNIR